MGFKTFRTSINWARIFLPARTPSPTRQALPSMTGCSTAVKSTASSRLSRSAHYELPYALVEKYNGWADRKLVDFYMNYCKTIFARYEGKVKYC